MIQVYTVLFCLFFLFIFFFWLNEKRVFSMSSSTPHHMTTIGNTTHRHCWGYRLNHFSPSTRVRTPTINPHPQVIRNGNGSGFFVPEPAPFIKRVFFLNPDPPRQAPRALWAPPPQVQSVASSKKKICLNL